MRDAVADRTIPESRRRKLGSFCSCVSDPGAGETLLRIRNRLDERRELETFGRELILSGEPSEDAFLENWKGDLKIGKAAIAASLVPCETPDQLIRRGERGIGMNTCGTKWKHDQKNFQRKPSR